MAGALEITSTPRKLKEIGEGRGDLLDQTGKRRQKLAHAVLMAVRQGCFPRLVAKNCCLVHARAPNKCIVLENGFIKTN